LYMWRYLRARRRRVVSSTPPPSYPQHPLGRKVSGPQSWSGRYEEENNAAAMAKNKIHTPDGDRISITQPITQSLHSRRKKLLTPAPTSLPLPHGYRYKTVTCMYVWL
jgi:hypothetical protein